MSNQPQADEPTPDQLRAQVERTRDQLGQTVEALAAKTDVKAQTKAKATEVKEQAAEQAALLTGHLRDKATQAAELIKDKTPDPVLDKAASAATLTRSNRTPLLVAATALALFLLLRRNRRHK
ncbi:DUF3618 domain-containing protein [Streptomyces sp. WAC07061]|uniref:DUF3618 domain-containing protein n=1 Tax=Streptomyces sp. WAC07061 TaxID=2487410 RepID=UPI000F7908E9|nr:DUF3618 domain-containing protein [Streptomyces sp. WAC07061]RSS45416.1 DUF3618 domain-containing protein [Streptomyces sp. WAC07061]